MKNFTLYALHFILYTFFFCIMQFAFPQHGAIQLPATGQTTSYYPGDDGDLQIGVPIPENRFTDHGNGSATDQFTDLMWATDANLIASRDPDFDQDRTIGDGDVNWDTALDYIQKLNNENYLGHNDWRMPNYLELLSLVNLGNDSITLPDGHPFINLQRGYWSSTTYDRFRSCALMVCLTNYVVHAGISYPAGHWEALNKDLGAYLNQYFNSFLIPVRDGTSGSLILLPETGQQSNYYEGDDGYWQHGIDWPSPRLASNNSGAVTDNLTGLMWTEDSHLMFTRDLEFDTSGNPNGMVPWIIALEYINKLNDEAYLGYNDWRMPNRKELASLIDYSRKYPTCLPENHPFTTTYYDRKPGEFAYWSSSTVADIPEQAWCFSFSLSNLYPSNKDTERVVWPVRTLSTQPPTGSIQGNILGSDMPLDNIEISISGPIVARTETNDEGYFEFLFLPDGNYTVTPYFEYYNITPYEKVVSVSGGSEDCDFDAIYNRAYGWVDISSNLYSVNGYHCPILNDVYFLDENEGWIVSMQDIYHTTDGGQSFDIQTLSLEGDYAEAIFMLNEDEGYAGSSGGFIYKTENGGEEWEIHGYAGSWISDIDFPSGSEIGYCTGDQGVFCQIDAEGVTQIETGLNGRLTGVSSLSTTSTFFASSPHRLFHWDGNEITPCCMIGEGAENIFFHTDTLGWSVSELNTIGGLHGIESCDYLKRHHYSDVRQTDLYSPNGKDMWIVGLPGAIIYSPNANDFSFTPPSSHNNTVWNRQAEGLSAEWLRSVYFLDPNCGYIAGNNGTLLNYTQLPGAPEGADILGVKFPGQHGKEEINTGSRTVNVQVADTIDITKLVPQIFVSAEAEIDPPSGVKQDFSDPVSYTVTSSDNITKIWTVSVTKVFEIEDFNPDESGAIFSVYPNPCSDKIQISNFKTQTNSELRSSLFELQITDLHGRVVCEYENTGIREDEIMVDVSHLPPGLYLVKMMTEDGVGVRKIIKQ